MRLAEHVETDWLGQFVVRASGKGLPALWREIIFEPLGMSPEECAAAKTPAILKTLAPIYTPLPEGGFVE
jgi:methyl acetate hydrolase